VGVICNKSFWETEERASVGYSCAAVPGGFGGNVEVRKRENREKGAFESSFRI
jgi:hypothetical protein